LGKDGKRRLVILTRPRYFERSRRGDAFRRRDATRVRSRRNIFGEIAETDASGRRAASDPNRSENIARTANVDKTKEELNVVKFKRTISRLFRIADKKRRTETCDPRNKKT